MDIGHKIKQLREQANLTQTDVGNFLGVTKATVARYENGEIDIKRTTAIKLAEIFNTSPACIMGWTDTQKDKCELSDREKALVFSYRSHPEMQAAVNKMLDIKDVKTAPADNQKNNTISDLDLATDVTDILSDFKTDKN